MSNNVIAFRGKNTRDSQRSISSTGRPYSVRGEKNMHTLLFRTRESILESDEHDLVRDVCFDIGRAQGKLKETPSAHREPARIHGR